MLATEQVWMTDMWARDYKMGLLQTGTGVGCGLEQRLQMNRFGLQARTGVNYRPEQMQTTL